MASGDVFDDDQALPLGDPDNEEVLRTMDASESLIASMGACVLGEETDAGDGEEEPGGNHSTVVERGCRDRDPLTPGVALSPVFRFGLGGGAVNFNWPAGHEHWNNGAQDSPRRLAKASELLAHAARGTFRLQTFPPKEDRPQHGTGGGAGLKSFVSAAHMLTTLSGVRQTRFRAMSGTPVFAEMFGDIHVPRVHLVNASSNVQLPGDPPLVDPITRRDVTDAATGAPDDVVFWELSDIRSGFDEPGLPAVSHSISPFWLPLSLEAENINIGQEPACAMVSYPCINGLRAWVHSTDDQQRDLLVKTYVSAIEPDMIRYKAEFKQKHGLVTDQEVKAHPQFPTFCLQVEKRIRDLLLETWQGVSDGDPVISLGRILGKNGSMLAHSLTSYFGSSGALIILLALFNLPWMYGGVHHGPAPKRRAGVTDGHALFPDHNVATSTDNLGFVIKFVRDAIPSIPEPTDDHWGPDGPFDGGIQKARKEAFTRWLVHHIWEIARFKRLVDSDSASWSAKRLAWIQETFDWVKLRLANRVLSPTVSEAAKALIAMPGIAAQLQSGLLACLQAATNDEELSQIFLVQPPVTWQSIQAGLLLPTLSMALEGQLSAVVARGIPGGVKLTTWNLPESVTARTANVLFNFAEELGKAGFVAQDSTAV